MNMVHPPPLEQQNRELTILNAIATALNESVNLAAALDVALSRVAELLHLRAGWIWLLDEETERPYLAAAQTLPEALSSHPERMEGGCHCLIAFRNGELHSAANVFTCSRLRWLKEGTSGLRFHASVPLHARGRKLGVLNVASTEWHELSSCELRLLHIIGEMLGVAIERSRLYERSSAAGAAEERNRLAREIHDTLAQGLAATVLQLETADALLEAGKATERAHAAVRHALQTTRKSLEDARRSVLDLRPAPLEGRSLAEALRELCGTLGERERPSIHFHVTGGSHALPARVEVGLYRVAQEALSNSLRHSDADTVSMRLLLEPRRVTLSVDDDGSGFEASGCDTALRSSRRFGLIGMCERVRLLDGTFAVQSSPGAGTAVKAVVPLP
jgi:two-component system NarL family sensor kinase